MPRHPRYVKNKRTGKRGTIVRGDLIHVPFSGLVGGATGQGIYEKSTVQRYDIGTRRVTPDGRVYRYGRCDQTIEGTEVGCKNHTGRICPASADSKATAAGALVVEIATDNFSRTLVEDELRGGYLSLHRDYCQQRMILHNTAVPVVAGATVFVTIADPLTTALLLGSYLQILGNPYRYLRCGSHNYSSVMGMPTRLVNVNEYFWIQTWGPCRISVEGAGYGDADNEQSFVFGSTGGVIVRKEEDLYAGYSKQLAGFVIELSGGGAQGSTGPFIMLQISP